jgi:hypothetical protein
MRGALGLSVVLALLGTKTARAEEPPLFLPGDRTTSRLPGEMTHLDQSRTDGVYGRFEHPFDLGLDGGAELGDAGAAGALLVSLHYLYMAGIYVAYSDALGQGSLPSSRSVSFGVDLRPAFIPRWTKGMQEGPGFVDLTVDSISLGLGAYFREPRERPFGDRRGLELSLGFGVPLVGIAEGPWLGARGVLRWDDPSEKSSEAARAAALLTFGWHFGLGG